MQLTFVFVRSTVVMVGRDVEILPYSFYAQRLFLPSGERGNLLCRAVQKIQGYQVSIVLVDSGIPLGCVSEVNGIRPRKERRVAIEIVEPNRGKAVLVAGVLRGRLQRRQDRKAPVLTL